MRMHSPVPFGGVAIFAMPLRQVAEYLAIIARLTSMPPAVSTTARAAPTNDCSSPLATRTPTTRAPS